MIKPVASRSHRIKCHPVRIVFLILYIPCDTKVDRKVGTDSDYCHIRRLKQQIFKYLSFPFDVIPVKFQVAALFHFLQKPGNHFPRGVKIICYFLVCDSELPGL